MNKKKLSRIAVTMGGVLFSLFFWALSPKYKQAPEDSVRLRTAENPLLFSIPHARADVPPVPGGDESTETCSDCGSCASGDSADCCD